MHWCHWAGTRATPFSFFFRGGTRLPNIIFNKLSLVLVPTKMLQLCLNIIAGSGPYICALTVIVRNYFYDFLCIWQKSQNYNNYQFFITIYSVVLHSVHATVFKQNAKHAKISARFLDYITHAGVSLTLIAKTLVDTMQRSWMSWCPFLYCNRKGKA